MNFSKNQIIAFIIVLTLIVSSSCQKPKTFSNIPQITYLDFVKFQSISGNDSAGILKFNFTDGDGDIGLNPWDTTGAYTGTYYSDFFAIQSELINDVWHQDTYKFNERIPFLTAEGSSKALQGEIDISWSLNNPIKQIDTVKWEFWICDRALNLSNHLFTPQIIVKSF
jgi:hypothetical protein